MAAQIDSDIPYYDAVIIGAGISGMYQLHLLRKQGLSVKVYETGTDIGGTWYWNRYPGAMCDTAAMIYLPLLEETGPMPTKKYAYAPEILRQCQRIGEAYNLYDNALFHTEVTGLRWDDQRRVWSIKTNRGDNFTAQFVGMGTGPLHVPKLPGIPGIKTFQGHAFHTSRWDYDYTGGSPEGDPLAQARLRSSVFLRSQKVRRLSMFFSGHRLLLMCERTKTLIHIGSMK